MTADEEYVRANWPLPEYPIWYDREYGPRNQSLI